MTDQLPSFSALLGNAWQLYRERYRAWLGILAIPLVINLLVVLSTSFHVRWLQISALPVSSALLIGAITSLIAMIFNIWSHLALIVATDKDVTALEAYGQSGAFILSSIGLSILTGLLVFGALLLLLVPGIILAFLLSFVFFVLVLEKKSVWQALILSEEYSSVDRGRVILRIIGIFVVVIVAQMLIGGLISLAAHPIANASTASNVASPFIDVLLMPLSTAYFYGLYKEARRLRGQVSDERIVRVGRFYRFFIVMALIGPFVIIALLNHYRLPSGDFHFESFNAVMQFVQNLLRTTGR